MQALEALMQEVQKSSHTIYQNVLRVLRDTRSLEDVESDEATEFASALIDEAAALFTAVGRMELQYTAGLLTVIDVIEMRKIVMDTFHRCDSIIQAFKGGI